MDRLRRLGRVIASWGWEVSAVVVAISVAAYCVPPPVSAQKIFNDTGHEVTLRNDPLSFTCSIVNSTATILTALGGSCVAPAVGQSIYITDISASASAASTTSADSFLELKSGTGGTCGTGTAVVWASYNAAMGGAVFDAQVPIKVAATSELCWMDAVVGSKTFIVTGYIK